MFASKISDNQNTQQTLDQATQTVEEDVDEMAGEKEQVEDKPVDAVPQEPVEEVEEPGATESSDLKEDEQSDEPKEDSKEVDLDEIAGLFK